MATLVGRVLDQANILRSGFSEFEKSVIKATRHNEKAPKEKHVRRLIVYTSEHNGRCSELLTLFSKRFETGDWIIVMKTLCVIHRLMRDANPKFMTELKYKSSFFQPLRNFADMSTPEAHHQSVFIRRYAQYLAEKILVYKVLGVEVEKDPGAIKNIPVKETLEKLPRVQSQLNALLNSRGSKDHINNAIIIYAFSILLKDSFPLYRAINDGILILLENYFGMPRENAFKTFEIYKLFTKETDSMIQFFDITRRFSRTDLPELQQAPSTVVDALEKYLQELDEGKSPESTMSAADKKNVSQMKSRMDNFRFVDDLHQENESDSEEEDRIKISNSDTRQRSSKPQSQSQSQSQTKIQSSSSSSSLTSQNLFDDDWFGSHSNSIVPTSPSQTPIGGSVSQVNNLFDLLSNEQGTQPFDPFGSASSSSNSYDDKKVHVQLAMSQPVFSTIGSPSPLQPLSGPRSMAGMPSNPFLPQSDPSSSSNPFLQPTTTPTNGVRDFNPFA